MGKEKELEARIHAKFDGMKLTPKGAVLTFSGVSFVDAMGVGLLMGEDVIFVLEPAQGNLFDKEGK